MRPRQIIQAPMAGMQGFEMAAAVYNAGGFGSIPCAMLSPAQIREQVTKFRLATNQPLGRVELNLNFFAHQQQALDVQKYSEWKATLQPYFDELEIRNMNVTGASRKSFDREQFDLVVELNPSVVSFHFGLPQDLDLVDAIRTRGIEVWSTATTVDEAVWLAKRHVDAIICQGSEAGGHRGMFLSQDLQSQQLLSELLPKVRQAVPTRLIAAGCCAENDPKRWFALGASAIQVGTCLLLTNESLATELHRKTLEELDDTAITNVFTGKPARGLVNRLVREQGPISPNTPGFPHTANLTGVLRREAENRGSADFTPLWRGQHWVRSPTTMASSTQVIWELASKL
ncbi:hypothetical protein BASA81_002628 [Batrachochytrium salamandrivorans]|nr:hypothetical protein BASA81_002628 [Batrachochytrium salamandrivorans]